MIYEIHHDGQTASTEEGATASDEEGGAAGARGEQRAGGDGRRQGQQRGTARQQQQATRRQAAAVQATDDGQGDPGTAPAQRSRASNLQLLSADDRSPGTAGPGRASTSSSSQERTAGCTATRFRCREALPARRTATRYAKRTQNGCASGMCQRPGSGRGSTVGRRSSCEEQSDRVSIKACEARHALQQKHRERVLNACATLIGSLLISRLACPTCRYSLRMALSSSTSMSASLAIFRSCPLSSLASEPREQPP